MNLDFYDVLLAIDSLAGLVPYLMENSTAILLLHFLLRIGFVERLETIVCAGALGWSHYLQPLYLGYLSLKNLRSRLFQVYTRMINKPWISSF